MISREIRAPAAVAIKLLWSEDGEQPLVHTFVRNRASIETRESYAPPNDFAWTRNTAFKKIVEQQSGLRYFASDNLPALAEDGKYENANERWFSLYTTAAVMAIPPTMHPTSVLGFLCVDSLYGRLTSTRVIRTLAVMARHLYNIFELCADIDLNNSVWIRSNRDEKINNSNSCVLGWSLTEDGRLQPADEQRQRRFQSVIRHLDARRADSSTLRAILALRGLAGGETLAQRSGVPMANDDFAVITEDDPVSPRIAAIRAKGRVTDNQFIAILEKIAPDNPYAEELLQAARRQNVG
jgi:hypothetical protein